MSLRRTFGPLRCALAALTIVLATWGVWSGCVPLPGGGAEGTSKTYVGKVNGTEALIGLIIDSGEILAYVCDAVEGQASISGWFEGTVADGAFTLKLVGGTGYEGTGAGRQLTGSINSGAAGGMMTLEDGTEHSWSAEPAAPGSAAGLYVNSDDEGLSGVVVSNDEQLRGLIRFRATGWTARVTAVGPLSRSGRLNVTAAARRFTVFAVRRLAALRMTIKQRPDPPPTVGNGTLMIMVMTDGTKAIGHRYIATRPDKIGIPTIRRTALLNGNKAPKRVKQAYMRVRVLDRNGAVLSGLYIDDPFNPFVEVPANEKGEGAFWTKVDQKIGSFLVAVPNLKGARKVSFTRFRADDSAINAGTIDLEAKSIAKRIDDRRAATGDYDAADAEHATVVDNGPPEDRFDLLIIGDGFQDTQVDRDAFAQGVQDVLNYLWTIPIYAEFQAAINVHTAYLPSIDSGADHPGEDVDLNTPFEAFYDCQGLDRLICTTSDGRSLAYEVAEGSPGNYGQGGVDAIMILVNDSEYGGGGGAVLTSSLDSRAPEIASHEFGHSAIGLADEYESEYDALVEAARTKPNVSGPVDSREELKWIDLVDPATDIPTEVDPGTCNRSADCEPNSGPLAGVTLPVGTVGMFEGAGYVACGSFKPTTWCQMRCYVDEFCPVCRQAFRDVLGPFAPPTVDVYMRDNSLDVGNVPSPSNIEDPPGSGNRVKPWHSVDIRVDAAPFGTATDGQPHENPIAGETNRVYVTVHNRGSDPSPTLAEVRLYFAPATGGAPPFPGDPWGQIGLPQPAQPPGQGGTSTVVFVWDAPAGLPDHTCLIATADGGAIDPLPPLTGSLSQLVRNSNNITWKNLHVVRAPIIEGEISSYEAEVRPIVLRIEAAGVPIGTRFDFSHDDTVSFTEFNPTDLRQMDVEDQGPANWTFRRNLDIQQWLQLSGNLPPAPGDRKEPFIATFVLKINLPGGTPTGVEYQISVDQFLLEPDSNAPGDPIGGNTYTVILE